MSGQIRTRRRGSPSSGARSTRRQVPSGVVMVDLRLGHSHSANHAGQHHRHAGAQQGAELPPGHESTSFEVLGRRQNGPGRTCVGSSRRDTLHLFLAEVSPPPIMAGNVLHACCRYWCHGAHRFVLGATARRPRVRDRLRLEASEAAVCFRRKLGGGRACRDRSGRGRRARALWRADCRAPPKRGD